jgi:basic membrane protein A
MYTKKSSKLSMLVLFLIFVTVFTGCIGGTTPVTSSIKVGIVFDIGGLGDKSFNDSAYRGIEWAETDFNIEHTELEPEVGGDLEASLRNLAMMDHDLVIGVGSSFTDAISTVADEFPETKFAIVDGFIPDKSNVVSLLFKENEGSFLVGIIAGMRAIEDEKDKVRAKFVVGFVGGMDIPLIHKFEAGYIAGVHYVYPECEILSTYVGSFTDPVQGKELALSQYDDGAWVIYHASGLTGVGVFEAGKERKRYVIGVDSNQNYMGYIEETGENFGLTSMLKQVDVSVYLTIKSVIEGTFTGGTEIFGLNKSVTIGGKEYYGVYYALDEYNEDLVTSEMIAQVEEARDKIISGEIIVPEEI